MALPVPARYTELEAINAMLKVVGESPIIQTLSGTLPISVQKAQDTLHEVTRDVCMEGWNFNRNLEEKLTKNIDGKFVVEANTLHIYPYSQDFRHGLSFVGNQYFVERNGFVYDLRENTDVWPEIDTLTVNRILFIPFLETPSYARNYIVSKSNRRYQYDTLGANDKDRYLAEQESRARISLEQADTRGAQYNLLDNPYATPGAYRNKIYRTSNFEGQNY